MNKYHTSAPAFPTLPDFLRMQRASFCWFLMQGISHELRFFSTMYEADGISEYFLYPEEYTLSRSPLSLSWVRKYGGTYRTDIKLPLEVHLEHQLAFSHSIRLMSVPLMTPEGNFVLNGCERVIISQIIRSPGIYFQKTQKQPRVTPVRVHLPADVTKLREFLPAGETLLSDRDLFFPEIVSYTEVTKRSITFHRIALWDNRSMAYYSFQALREQPSRSSIYFLRYFQGYQKISQTSPPRLKSQSMKLWLTWCQQFSRNHRARLSSSPELQRSLLHYFNFLNKLLATYQWLDREGRASTLPGMISFCLEHWSLVETPSTFSRFTNRYQRLIQKVQRVGNVQANAGVLVLTQPTAEWSLANRHFSSLKQQIQQTVAEWTEVRRLRPILYFSETLKDQGRYDFYRKNPDGRHKYLKRKQDYIFYKQDHPMKLASERKYETKEPYRATLIPESGAWIRFGFQKATHLNRYSYPIKHRDEELMIQLDKVNQKPILAVFHEMGLTDLEIYQNLQHADFFYFTEPLLLQSSPQPQPVSKFQGSSLVGQEFSEFGKIFDPAYYRLGSLGRQNLNRRLKIGLSQRVQSITYDDVFAILNQLMSLTLSKTLPDDIDHLKNRRVRSVGELLTYLIHLSLQRLQRKMYQDRDADFIPQIEGIMMATLREFFNSSELSQYLDEINPLASLTSKRRLSGFGPGGFDSEQVSFSVRAIHPSQYGRICPIETPEGKRVGLVSSLTTYARVNRLGSLETPFWRVHNGKVLKTGQPIYLTADMEDFYKIAPADLATNSANYLLPNVIPVRYQQEFWSVTPSEVDFIAISPIQMVSMATSLIPFFEHDDANRALMGSNMQRQSVPLLFPQKPIVGTGLEHKIAKDSRMGVTAKGFGTVTEVTATNILVRTKTGKTVRYPLEKYRGSNQRTCIHQRPVVWKGEEIVPGKVLADGPSMNQSELSLGQNVLLCYMPWQGYNFEDAILISDRLVYENIFTSLHLEKYSIVIDTQADVPEQITKEIPHLPPVALQHLTEQGIVKVGTFVRENDILVGKIISNTRSEQLPESKLLRAIFGVKATTMRDNSYRLPEREYGRVIETTIPHLAKLREYEILTRVDVYVAQMRKIKVGDKIAGRHGNKGIVSRILPRQDMPFLPDGTPIDIVLNPLGVPSRMNVGQLYECLLGLAGDKLNVRFKILPFDEMYGVEASRILINKKLREASRSGNESWLFNPYAPGKVVLMDGRTGLAFENPVTVGNAHMLKLIHLVDDKIHARATGPYSLVTQQPLRGRANQGGQRFGEMEVWALEGFGAAFTLQELLTIKSDDIDGRNETLHAIVKGIQLPNFGIPESFKVLLQELRSIGLDISTHRLSSSFSMSRETSKEVSITEVYHPWEKRFYPKSQDSLKGLKTFPGNSKFPEIYFDIDD